MSWRHIVSVICTATVLSLVSAHGGLLTVTQVRDGATVVLEDSDIVRYYGIEVPAAGLWAAEAREFNEQLTLGKLVTVVSPKLTADKQTIIAEVLLPDGRSAAQVLVANGVARVSSSAQPGSDEKFGLAPDTDELLLEAQARAQSQGLGIWGAPVGEVPFDQALSSSPTASRLPLLLAAGILAALAGGAALGWLTRRSAAPATGGRSPGRRSPGGPGPRRRRA